MDSRWSPRVPDTMICDPCEESCSGKGTLTQTCQTQKAHKRHQSQRLNLGRGTSSVSSRGLGQPGSVNFPVPIGTGVYGTTNLTGVILLRLKKMCGAQAGDTSLWWPCWFNYLPQPRVTQVLLLVLVSVLRGILAKDQG